MALDRKGASPFHAGERAVQSRLGVREQIEPRARQAIRSSLSQQQRDFFSQVPFVVAAARDGHHRTWATLLLGPPGFAASRDSSSLHLGTRPLPGDALESALGVGAGIGLLGIDLESRRRVRVNGTIRGSSTDGLLITVSQAFGNCPRYINRRSWQAAAATPEKASTRCSQRLDGLMRDWIEQADTLFIASGYSGRDSGDRACGLDASHRGGPPGFVKVLDANRLILPDYAGNNYFNTLGNLVMDPRVGLLFVDFRNGSLLQISGRASIDWDFRGLVDYPGALRLVAVTVERVVHLEAMLPLRWTAVAPSAF